MVGFILAFREGRGGGRGLFRLLMDGWGGMGWGFLFSRVRRGEERVERRGFCGVGGEGRGGVFFFFFSFV